MDDAHALNTALLSMTNFEAGICSAGFFFVSQPRQSCSALKLTLGLGGAPAPMPSKSVGLRLRSNASGGLPLAESSISRVETDM